MTPTHLRKIVRDITARKTRTALVTLGIFVGVLGIVVLTTVGQLITRQLDEDLDPDRLAMLRIYLTMSPYVRVDNSAVLQMLRDHPGVTEVEGQAAYTFDWRLPEDPEFRTGEIYAYTVPLGDIQLEPPRLIRGRFPRPETNEITIDLRMADAHDLGPGDTVIARSAAGGELTLDVTGVLFQPYLYIGAQDGSAAIYTELDLARQITGYPGLSSIYLRMTDFRTMREESQRVRNLVKYDSPYRAPFYLVNDPDHNAFVVGVRQFRNVLLIISVVAMVVSSFLVTNVITTIITEQREQIGAMKALGATQADILIMYLGIAFGYGVIGTIPAILIGVPLGQTIAETTAPIANTILQDTSPPLEAILLGLAMGLLVPVLGAIVPVINGSRVTILEAMSDFGIHSRYGKGPLAWLVGRMRASLPMTIALNNLFSHKARLALTALALTLAAGAFMGVFSTFQRLVEVVGDVRETMSIELDVDPGQIQVRDLVQSLLSDSEIREIAPDVAVKVDVGPHYTPDVPVPTPTTALGSVRSEAEVEAPAETEQRTEDHVESIFVVAVDPALEMPDFVMTVGTGWENDPDRAGIVLSTKLAERFDKVPGDMIELSSPENTTEFEVIGIAEFPLDVGFMRYDELSDFVGPLRDAPEPNGYWEPVDIVIGEDFSPEDATVWGVGIDQRVGQFFVPDYDPEVPGVIISQSLADRLGLQEGDAITLYAYDQSLLDQLISERARTYPILRVADVTSAQLGLVVERPPEGLLDIARPELVALHWSELAELAGLDYSTVTPETFLVNVTSADAVPRPKAVYENQLQFADRVVQTVLSLGMVMNAASLLMAVVGGIGLMTIMTMNVHERQRQIGVMRSVGATTRAIMFQFILEGAFFGIGTWLVGIPISYALSQVLLRSVPYAQVIGFRYTWITPLVGLVGMLILTGIATFFPAVRAGRKTVSEILRYQ